MNNKSRIFTKIKDSVKKAVPNDVPLPAGLKGTAINIEKEKSIETEVSESKENVAVKTSEIQDDNSEFERRNNELGFNRQEMEEIAFIGDADEGMEEQDYGFMVADYD